MNNMNLTTLKYLSRASESANVKSLLLSSTLPVLEQFVLPDLSMFLVLLFLMGFDFFTGVAKSWLNKKPVTSMKMRQTLPKVTQYMGTIILLNIVAWFSLKSPEKVTYVPNAYYTFLGLVELRSIAENLRDINPESPVAKHIITPVLDSINKILKRKNLP